MNKYSELRQRQQQEFNALPLGFAFSQKQFDEMMEGWGLDPEKDLDNIYRIPAGGYVQKKNADLLHQTTKRHSAEMAAAIAEDKTGDDFIYQMFKDFRRLLPLFVESFGMSESIKKDEPVVWTAYMAPFFIFDTGVTLFSQKQKLKLERKTEKPLYIF